MTARHIRSGVPLRASTALLLCFVLFGVLLTGCAPIERQQATSLRERQWQARVRAWWAQLSGSASGAISVTRETVEGSIDAGKQAVQGVQETVEDIKSRAAKVEEGVERIQEGRELIEEGVGR